MQKYTNIPGISDEIKYWINHNLANYIKSHGENQGEIEHIIDYFCSDAAPKRLMKMSYVEAKRGTDKWVAAMNKKANNIMETEADVEVRIDFDNGVKLVKLVGKHAFQREGLLMSNCVASYYGKDGCEIFSLRDSKNLPHVTIEVFKSDGNINQIKGKGNGSIHPKYVKYVLAGLKEIGNEVRLSEMTYLGYDTLPDKTWWQYLEANFKGVQYIMYQGEKLLYKHSKLVPKGI